MYDRQTFTLWSNLTGEPVIGKMATSGLRLKILPMTLTTWDEWKRMHPDTKALFLKESEGKQWNFVYEPGLADRARSGVSFPVWQKSKVLDDREEVYALRIGDWQKAYSIKRLAKERIVNDMVGDTPVVLILDPVSESVRAYYREALTFSSGAKSDTVKDDSGRVWQIREEALSNNQETLKRIPGHISLWFAWYGFFPQTEIYR